MNSKDGKTRQKEKSATSLPLPIYLDYSIIFDMLAILDDGISEFEEVKTVYSDESSSGGDVKLDGGGKVPLGFLSMNIAGGGMLTKSSGKTDKKEIASKKVHTSVSLFAKTKDILGEKGLIKDNLRGAQAGDFVEFQAKFQRPEIVRVVDTMVKAMEIGNKFANTGGSKQKPKLPKEFTAMQETLDPIKKSLLLYKVDDNNRILLELNEESMVRDEIDQILRGEYKIFGKVIRVERNGFNLFEATDFAFLKPEMLTKFLSDAFSEIVSDSSEVKQMFDIPDEVPIQYSGTVLIIKPIAIFI